MPRPGARRSHSRPTAAATWSSPTAGPRSRHRGKRHSCPQALRSGPGSGRDGPSLAVPAAALVLAAAASPVVVRFEAGAVAAIVLIAAVALYDGAVFIVGTGSRNRWEGPVAGMVTLAPLMLLVASIASPPF